MSGVTENGVAFGYSKLELRFMHDFLDVLGIDYVWQFSPKGYHRVYDFYVPSANLIIEIDGSWFHSDPRVVNEDNRRKMHERNKLVDEAKNEWALTHGFPIMRIWEYDIDNNPSKVMSELKARLGIEKETVRKKAEKNKRHKNTLNDDL